jgi:very-long-chain (3R)-3-hydroxyacyl-CoA dehydratase
MCHVPFVRSLTSSEHTMAKAYLFLYNSISAVGWAYVFYLSLTSYINGRTPAEVWSIVEAPLKLVQTLAFLEILHSALRVVKSPLGPSLMQVSSRLFLLWGITNASPASQAHWSLYFMLLSWSFVEIPRYTFYALNQYLEKVRLCCVL